jgi:CRP-like cAMP-binding protein
MRNRLMASLSPAQQRLLAPFEPVTFKRGEYLYRFDQRVEVFVLIETGVISVIRPLADGDAVEVFTYGGGTGLVVAGHTLFQAYESLYDYKARTDVTGWRVSRERVEAAMRRDPALRALLKGAVHVMDNAVAQAVACRSIHSAEQRLARTLLTLRETMSDERITLPRTVIAPMVPCAARGIYRVAKPLIAEGIIRFTDGSIEILDVEALRQRSCECFAALLAQKDALFKNT